MEMQIREYQKQDFQPLKEIIRSTWHYDEFSSPETASRLAEVFLRSCLTNYTLRITDAPSLPDFSKSCPL
ncbi:hypothetical protein [Dysosmobacter welbionis]